MMTMSVDDKRNSPKDAPQDPWADWKPQWQKPRLGKRAKKPAPPTPHDVQERHSPTETVTTQQTAARTQDRCQRRIVDARLWQSMSAPQQSAALDIARAFETMGRGLGYVTSDWQRIPGGGHGNVADMHARLIGDYVDWTKRCHAEKISHSMIIDVLVFGFSCRALDADRRVRAGTARENLLCGLSLYCRLRGWPEQ